MKVPITIGAPTGRYDELNQRYPELLRVKFKKGAKEMLEQQARSRGFSSISTMVRAALKYALRDPDFKK